MSPNRMFLAALLLLPALSAGAQTASPAAAPDAAAAAAQPGNLFEVRNVAVDAAADSAIAARDKAIGQGYAKAFDELAKRVLADGAAVPRPSTQQLDQMIQNFDVQSERTTAKRYIATLSFRFRPDATRAYLSRNGGHFAAGVAEPTDPAVAQMAQMEPWTGGAQRFGLVLPITQLSEWIQVRDQLARVPGLRKLEVQGISRSEVRMAVDFAGDANRLTAALGTAGLGLGQPVTLGQNLPGGSFALVPGMTATSIAAPAPANATGQ